MNEKTIQCLPNSSQHVPIYLQHFPSYSNRKCKNWTPPLVKYQVITYPTVVSRPIDVIWVASTTPKFAARDKTLVEVPHIVGCGRHDTAARHRMMLFLPCVGFVVHYPIIARHGSLPTSGAISHYAVPRAADVLKIITVSQYSTVVLTVVRVMIAKYRK